MSSLSRELRSLAEVIEEGDLRSIKRAGATVRRAAALIDDQDHALASKIGSDWRDALPYETELELREVIVEQLAALRRLRDLVELGLTPCPWGTPHTVTGEEATNAVIAADVFLKTKQASPRT